MRLRYEVIREAPVRVAHLEIGGRVYATPAVVSPASDGRHVIRGHRVTLAAGGELSERWSRRLDNVDPRARIVETVVDASVSSVKPASLEELARVVAEECPEGLYCLPPIVVGAGSGLQALYDAVNRGFGAGGGDACAAPLYDAKLLEEILASCSSGLLVVDAGRRAWRSLREGLRLLRRHSGLVYLVNVYRGGGLPRPARDLTFFLHGIDILGFSRPTLRQLAVIKRRGGGVARYGLDPHSLEYRPGAPPSEKVVEELLERVEESNASSLEELLRSLCRGCEWLLEEALLVHAG